MLSIFHQTQTICTEQGQKSKLAQGIFLIYAWFASMCGLLFAQLDPDVCCSKDKILMHCLSTFSLSLGNCIFLHSCLKADNLSEHITATRACYSTQLLFVSISLFRNNI